MIFRPCIVVPVYNHAEGTQTLVGRVAALDLEVILVNDASEHACTEVLRELAEIYDWVHLVEHEENLGKGGAVLSGLRLAHERGFTHALQIDADGQHDPDDIPRFLALAEARPHAVVTGRPLFDESVPRGRRLARYLTHVWIWVETLSFEIRDSMCGFRVYPLPSVIALAERVRLGRRMDFDSEILVRLSWEGLPVLSLSTRVVYPANGLSHFRLWEDNWLITRMHTRLVFGMLRQSPSLLLRRAREPRNDRPTLGMP